MEEIVCPKCKTSFENFEMNINLISGEVKFYCPVCGKSL